MTGFGYDVHRLAQGETLVLGGVSIESSIGTVAHSDGDVVLHALCDALLGAAGLGDIGEHFPDTDPQWKNAPSSKFVLHVCSLLQSHNLHIVNADIALTLEAPKILPYKQRMRSTIASLLSLPENRVNIKATTAEKLGFIGRGEGVACYCVCQLTEEH
ncbi:MAG: 2-C-methyl-D-erythritol 2,4-cyclodiphosphate synthase [Candidatus Kapaibacterium sp.]|jgi:2-C-methyl-D-erythritol 2,4-cyclodiphosphate synthase